MKVIILAVLLATAFAWESFPHGDGPFDHMSNEEFAAQYLLSAEDAPTDTPTSYDLAEFNEKLGWLSSFDWRNSSDTSLTHCVGAIRDQGKCGSCWAHAVTEMMSDRLCIESNGTKNVTFSPQYMVDCADKSWGAEGCGGADTQNATRWLGDNGMRTESCYPYVSGTTEEAGTCQPLSCPSGTGLARYTMNKDSVQIYNDYPVVDLATDIQKNGPIYMSVVVFADFKSYKSGVYYPISYEVLGTHAIKCLGWGWDDEHKSHYWICANSWTTGWGEEGFFRIGFNNFIGYKAGSARNGYHESNNPFVKISS
jgi:C1A family cysteine protease